MAMLLNNFEIESVGTPDGGEAREHLAFTMYPEDLRRAKSEGEGSSSPRSMRVTISASFVAGRGHADLGALARDVAVHRVDLGAPAFEDVLRHRGTLDVRARVGAGLRHDQRLHFRQRARVAFVRARDLLGVGAAVFSSW